MSRRRVVRRSRPRSRRNLPLLVAVFLVVIAIAVPAASFTTATLPRGASIDVVDDASGAVGLDTVSNIDYGTSGRLVTVTNNFAQTGTVTVTLGPAAAADSRLVVDGVRVGSQATFSLAPGESKDVFLEIRNDQSLVGDTFAYDVTLDVPGTAATAPRQTTVSGTVVVSDPGIAFIDTGGSLSVVDATGQIRDTGETGVQSFGPNTVDFDGDGEYEIPVTNSGGDLYLVDPNGQRTLLARGVAQAGVRLGVGDSDGDGTQEVLFVGTDGTIYRIELGGSPEQVLDRRGSSIQARSIAGVGDFNGDGDAEVIYVGTSGYVCYLDGLEACVGSWPSSVNAIGSPADFDGDGRDEVPLTRNNKMYLAEHSGETTIQNKPVTKIASLGAFDWDGDGQPEIVFVNDKDNNAIYYMELNGDHNPVLSGGAKIYTDGIHGVA